MARVREAVHHGIVIIRWKRGRPRLEVVKCDPRTRQLRRLQIVDLQPLDECELMASLGSLRVNTHRLTAYLYEGYC